VPDAARKQVRFVWLERIDDAIAAALVPDDEREESGATTSPPAARADRQAARSA
jgi:ATP-dependent Lon protease